jgi:hypothetical protein
MSMPTVERAYALARSGKFSNIDTLKDRLKADGCRAVDALLANRSIRGHIQAICAATFKPPIPDPETIETVQPEPAQPDEPS